MDENGVGREVAAGGSTHGAVRGAARAPSPGDPAGVAATPHDAHARATPARPAAPVAPVGADAGVRPPRSLAERDVTAHHLAPSGGVLLEEEAAAAEDAEEDAAPPPNAARHIELPELRRLLPAASSAGRDDDAWLPERLGALLAAGPLDAVLAEEPPGTEERIVATARRLAARAYPVDGVTVRQGARGIDHAARDAHHRALLAVYQQHMRLPHHALAVNQFHPLPCRVMAVLEGGWERDMLARAGAGRDISGAALPADPDAFVDWYRTTAFTHPLYEHDLYAYVANEADRGAVEWFLRMESAGEAAFDDLVALAQVGTRGEVKIEMASNYWDEMGNGKSHKVHTHMFHRLVEGLGIEPPAADELPWQVLAGVNVMLWSCIPRRNAFRAQGALGAVELLAPQRCTRLVHGARRVGIDKRTMSYYGAHAIIDVGHAEGWLDHVVRPQVAELPESRVGIAEGLLVRADASLDYFDWCLSEMRKGAGRS